MSYRELLDPKGSAKAKAKKRPPSYGPQQFRKPKPQVTDAVEQEIKTPKFDPKLLLNPKAAAAQTKTSSAPESLPPKKMEDSSYHVSDAVSGEQSGGMGSFLERIHNVKKREDISQPRKRKAESVDDSDENDSDKKSKPTFSGGQNGGIIGERMKAEREKHAAESGPMPTIDLTNEDEEDEDVVIISENVRDNSNEEICLGRLHAKAHAFRIPASPRYRQAANSKEMWPMDRLNFKRVAAHNNIIDLYDRSATDVNMGSKFGNLEVKAAAALCPLLDGNAVNKFRIKIFVDVHAKKPGEHPGMAMSKLIPLSIILYAPRKFQQAIGRHLSQKQIFLSDPHTVDPGVEIDNPHNPKIFGQPTSSVRKTQSSQSNVVTRTQEEMSRDAQNMFDSLTKSDDLPEMECNNEIIKTLLMSHQKQALSFMTQHESVSSSSPDDKGFSLWQPRTNKKGREIWMNVITGHEVEKPPPPVRGGILADMMGLGKTLSILALIAETIEEARTFGEEEPPLELETVERNAKTTLIICPKSVMTNWHTQIQEHAKANKLSVYSYHGPTRMQDVDELAKYDIILSSYNTAQAEFGDKLRRRNALAAIQWFRIVLDEGHQIRNASTGVSKACCALLAQRRWAVTGTPVQNRLDDLGALIRFLHIKPFDEDQNWTQYIISPFRAGNANVLQHLRLLVASITLRRHKDRIGLTERNEKLVRLDFTADEFVAYAQFARQANEKLRIMTGENNRLQGKSYAHVLRALGRLRMLCAHGKEMLSEDDQRELEGLTMSTAIDLGDEPDGEPDDSFVSSKHAHETFHMMSETEANVCTGCGEKVGLRALEVTPDAAEESESEDNVTADDDADVSNDTGDDVLGYLNPCYHLFCTRCKDNYVNEALPNLTVDGYHKCVYCEQYIRFGLFEILRSELKRTMEARASAASKKGKKAKWNELSYSGPHTKVKALLEGLKESAQETASLGPDEPPIRSVVFSGWTQYLDLIEYALEKNGFQFLRLDGSMSVKARSAVLRAFATDPKITVLLVSIKAGGQGLNFTAANKVYMMEPQFNPGVEQQAVDRVHRLGQTRHVHITRFIMRESVEEGIIELQNKKNDLARLTMERKMSKADEAQERIKQLKELFK